MIAAKPDAKFWIPPIEATCRSAGSTSAGSDQLPEAANADPAQATDSSAGAIRASGTHPAGHQPEVLTRPGTESAATS
ncbi:hypothetical protein ACIBI9_19875 [Nonomuraea sp. NPDC050451]|uniref:hypothetical protein n=1 Tax=Nonomuraea sp. NPDC050451 TaxID=3364364 RepID=UPI0037BCC3C3